MHAGLQHVSSNYCSYFVIDIPCAAEPRFPLHRLFHRASPSTTFSSGSDPWGAAAFQADDVDDTPL